MPAFAAVEILEDLVGNFEPFELNDADEFVAVFPNLPLLKFQRHIVSEKTVSPDSNPGETIELFLLAGRLFTGNCRFFMCGGAVGFGLLLTGLFLVRFRGFISHDV
jgi:hypothetical protein